MLGRIILLSVLAAGALAMFQLVPSGQLNLASVGTTKAAFGDEAWPDSEALWFEMLRLSPGSPQLNSGIRRFYQTWNAVHADTLLKHLEDFGVRRDLPAQWSDELTALGNWARGTGQLQAADAYYRSALELNDFTFGATKHAAQFMLDTLEHMRGSTSGDEYRATEWAALVDAGTLPIYNDVSIVGPLCEGCQVRLSMPSFGRGLYQLIFDARSSLAGAEPPYELDANAAVTLLKGLQPDQSWRTGPDQEWRTYSDLIQVMSASDPSVDFTLTSRSPGELWLRNVQFRWLNAPSADNLLLNASFEIHRPANLPVGDDDFLAWDEAIFWNESQAQGWRRAVGGNGSDAALELGLTQAAGYPQRLGVQQECGTVEPGEELELLADIQIPEELHGTFAEASAVIYDPLGTAAPVALSVKQVSATNGWRQVSVSAQAPHHAGHYQCMFILQLVAEQPITNSTNIVRFDNIVLRAADQQAVQIP